MANSAYDGEPPVPAGWVAPDDARELELDRLAWLREQRARQRDSALRRLLAWPRPLISGGLALLAVLVAAVAVVAPGLIVPASRPAPLAHPTAPAGTVGGLLPPVSLQVAGGRRQARALRPVVLALVPDSCRCPAAVGALAQATGRYGVPLVLIAPASQGAALMQAAPGGRVFTADDGGALSAAYRPQGLTAVLVRADGVVAEVERQLSATRTVGVEVAELTR